MHLGIDIGTSGVKTVLTGEAGDVVVSASERLVLSRPRPGWSEQDPRDWWHAVCATLDTLCGSHPVKMEEVTGIGLSGQMHGATLLDAANDVLRPAILWNDGRSQEECAELEGRADFRGIGGNLVMPGFTAPKLEWVRKHEPEVFERIARVLLPKDYIRLLLTGEAVSDMSDASGTLWLDVGKRAWSHDLLDACGLSSAQMPSLVEGTEVSGTVRRELCHRWGLSGSPVVAGGAGDNAASACALGVISQGDAFLSLGTSGVLFAATDGYRPHAPGAVHAFAHALPGMWHQMGVMLAASDSLEWLAGLTGSDAATLVAEADHLRHERPGPSPVVFLPYLSGERTPHNDPAARGAFIGLERGVGRADLALAVLEGIAFGLRDCKDALEQAGTRISRLTAIGGGARSDLWLSILTDVLACEIDRPAHGDFGAAVGAARLARAAVTKASFPRPPITAAFRPKDKGISAYAAAQERYRALYPMLAALPD
ncbi:xylulokinase [Stappia sp. ES.058]|uniref:xylulokinase n=1 Tax=Stappia sp. ES.058 TaxID=1881061 RepID=UPI00087A2CED|nr:xylulokinase [Stappia sp. ES.058]SDU10210.1 xylulokinase [Stappia sp. ES.058]